MDFCCLMYFKVETVVIFGGYNTYVGHVGRAGRGEFVRRGCGNRRGRTGIRNSSDCAVRSGSDGCIR